MREIVLDTETTGLDPASGHRIVEIGCIELINHVATENTYHVYVNPQRDMPAEAFAVHGLSEEFLAGHPTFDGVADAFLDFIADDPLVIHNAAFDLGFLNAELALIGRDPIAEHRAVDTVSLARSKFPGQRASLDALCKRFGIDNSHRDLHGALKDSELLALVYLELLGGRQQGLGLAADTGSEPSTAAASAGLTAGPSAPAPRPPRPHAESEEERARHAAFLEKLTDPVWTRGAAEG
jgi:DNA polymerase-3 subunit epsilon